MCGMLALAPMEESSRSQAARPQAGRPMAITTSRVPIEVSVSDMRHCHHAVDRGGEFIASFAADSPSFNPRSVVRYSIVSLQWSGARIHQS